MEDSYRMVNLNLAGGLLLGLGVYPLNLVFQVLYHLQPQEEKETPRVHRTGVDESVTILLDFPNHGRTGIVTSLLRVATDPGPAIRIQGSRGEIRIEHPAYKPQSFKVIRTGEDGPTVEVVECPQPQDEARGWGNGTFWEADEAARCIRDRKIESSVMPLDESVLIMSVMDEVLKEAGVRYPEPIASHKFDPLSPLNTGN